MNNLVFDYFNYEKIEKIDIGYKSPMIKIKNLKIINNSEYDTIKVDGKNFIFFLSSLFRQNLIYIRNSPVLNEVQID